jgi:hypothetical protein
MELVREISSIANAYNYAKSFKKRFITNCFITTEQFKKTILNHYRRSLFFIKKK